MSEGEDFNRAKTRITNKIDGGAQRLHGRV